MHWAAVGEKTMREITMFYFPECPYCARALRWHEELMEQRPELREIPFRLVDENVERALADSFDYYYVPAYYLDGTKICEGVKKKALVEEVFNRAYSGH